MIRMKMKIIFYLIIITIKYASSALSSLPGEIFPATAEIQVGDSINITCQMNPHALEGKSSKDLLFVDEETQVPVALENVFIVNETAIVYMLKNATEQQTRLMCKCDNDAIMVAKIYVGYPPLPIEKFNCRSYDFEYMICNFTQPKNPILTTYNLSYFMENPEYKYYPICNYEDKPIIVCNTTIKTTVNYHYILQASNELGYRIQNFTINNWDVMEPGIPGENLRIINLTTNNLEIAWRMSKFDKYPKVSNGRSKGFKWEILLKPKDFPQQNLTDTIWPERSRGEWHLTLDNLPYAWYVYDLFIRVRVNLPNTPWSEQMVFNFQTAPCKPNRPPTVLPGSFYIDSTETKVKIYWEQLHDYERNGDNFSYVIDEVLKDGNNIQLKPISLAANSALFSWDRRSQYEFKIRSRNLMGVSSNASSLRINPLPRNVNYYTPRSIHNVYHATNQTYTLSWQAPLIYKNLKDYTVYWCHSQRASQIECKGSIRFKNIPSSVTKFVTDHQEYTLNLAVSANYEGINTGMHWTDCSQDVNSDLVKMEPSVQILNATSLKISWYPEKICPSILSGYNISYCDVEDNSAAYPSCVKEPTVISVNNHMKKYEITNLKAFKSYKIEMYMYSASKQGKASEPIIVKTLESAPTAPRDLRVIHIGNTSVTLEWQPPLEANGIIRSYSIHFTDRVIQVEVSAKDDPLQSVTQTISNLTSYTSYEVYVVAETNAKSNTSNIIAFKTLVGYPSRPRDVGTAKNNASIIEWNRPEMPSGRIDYYEVAIIQYNGEERVNRFISFVAGNKPSCLLRRQPTCTSADSKTIIEVRAVNAAVVENEIDTSDTYYDSIYSSLEYVPYHEHTNNEHDIICDNFDNDMVSQDRDYFKKFQDSSKYRLLKSQWQGGTFYNCSIAYFSKMTIFGILMVLVSGMVIMFFYVLRKKIKRMSNIKCTLPAGLESMFDKDPSTKIGNNMHTINGSLNFSQTDLLKGLDCEKVFPLFDADDEENENHSRSQNNIHDPDPDQQQQHRHHDYHHKEMKDNNDVFNYNLSENEQQRHLLEGNLLAHDSGFIPDFKNSQSKSIDYHPSSEFVMKNDNNLYTNEYMLMKNGSSVDSLTDDVSSLHSNDSINETSLNENHHHHHHHKILNNGYTNANDLMKWSPKSDEKPNADACQTVTHTDKPFATNLNNTNDYLTVDALLQHSNTTNSNNSTNTNATLPNVSNQNSGYVQVSQLQQQQQLKQKEQEGKQTQSESNTNARALISGYTTLAELAQNSSAPNVRVNVENAREVPQMPSASPQISGYVKQHDLTIFGKNQQQQHEQIQPQEMHQNLFNAY